MIAIALRTKFLAQAKIEPNIYYCLIFLLCTERISLATDDVTDVTDNFTVGRQDRASATSVTSSVAK